MAPGISWITAERLEHQAKLVKLPIPKTEDEAMQLLIKAQDEYFKASKKHIALLDSGIASREKWLGWAAEGHSTPQLFEDRGKKESASAAELRWLARRVEHYNALLHRLKKSPADSTKDLAVLLKNLATDREKST